LENSIKVEQIQLVGLYFEDRFAGVSYPIECNAEC
jgi:hypothetical protein